MDNYKSEEGGEILKAVNWTVWVNEPGWGPVEFDFTTNGTK